MLKSAFLSILSASLLTISTAAHADTMINGAGSTFAEPIFTKWFAEYRKVKPEISINYQGIGSSGGIRQFLAGTVDFGATDTPMNAEEATKTTKKVLHVPVVMGAVVVSYNLKLSAPLKLTGPVVAEIFDGRIKKWNDPKIVALNKGVALPDLPIIVVTRADGSGTTAVFTEYLSMVSPEWQGKAGKTVKWFPGSVGAKGNAGVAGMIQQAEGSVGYIESVYALQNKLPFAHLQNKRGKMVGPELANISAAVSKAKVAEIDKAEFKASVVDADGENAYPIAAMTWVLVYEEMPKDKGQPIVDMLQWVLSEGGQKMTSEINYAPIPKELRDKVLTRVKAVKLQ